jgi:hypothetical protein
VIVLVPLSSNNEGSPWSIMIVNPGYNGSVRAKKASELRYKGMRKEGKREVSAEDPVSMLMIH